MKLLIFFLAIFFLNIAEAQVRVKGYYRRDGTYVRPHTRSHPNSSVTDNYGNTNYRTENSYNNTTGSMTWVDGYYRKDGTYVSGHWRSVPNKSNNNYSNNKNSYGVIPESYNPAYEQKIRYHIIASKRDVYLGPSKDYPIEATLNFYDEVELLDDKHPNWKKIKFSYWDEHTFKTSIGYVYTNGTEVLFLLELK